MVRLKQRYLTVQLLPNEQYGATTVTDTLNKISTRDIQIAVRDKIKELFGEVGLGEVGHQTYVKYYHNNVSEGGGKNSSSSNNKLSKAAGLAPSRICLLKTVREAESKVHFALSCITHIREQPLTIRALCTNSCPRTCADSLRRIMRRYVESVEFESEDAKNAIARSIEETIGRLEL